MSIITLTTDFGLSDPFVGVMKGVILGIAPEAVLVDICHAVPPQNILVGALMLEAALPYFPTGTIHLAVVDPGVGSERAALAIETEQGFLVGSDNGLFTLVLARFPLRRAVRLTNDAYHRHPVSATFHGRDIFAPAAAHLATGTPLEALGESVVAPVFLPIPQPIPRGESLELHILTSDHFGNLITDLTQEEYAAWQSRTGEAIPRLLIGKTSIAGITRTYADVEPGRPVAYFGSGGRLEIGVRNGNAAERLGVRVGGAISMAP